MNDERGMGISDSTRSYTSPSPFIRSYTSPSPFIRANQLSEMSAIVTNE